VVQLLREKRRNEVKPLCEKAPERRVCLVWIPHRVSVMSVYITHTHRQIDRNRTGGTRVYQGEAKNICALWFTPQKTLIWSCLIDPPSPFQIYWNDPAAGQPRSNGRTEKGGWEGGNGFSPCQHCVSPKRKKSFLFLRFHFVSGGLFQPVHVRK